MSVSVLPNFIIIGAMKSGTTSLHDYLSRHPDIFMSVPKETDFFTGKEPWEKGIEGYKACFAGYAGQKAVGEASPNYAKMPFFEGVPERIYSVLGPVKLIYVVRDPVERLVTHYVHALSSGHETRPFAKVLKNIETTPYSWTSRYYAQLEKYLEFFPKECLLIVDQHALKNERKETLRRIFRFLEVEPDFYCPEFEKNIGESKYYGRKTFLGNVFQKPSRELWGAYHPQEPKPSWFQKMMVSPIGRPELSARERQKLNSLFSDEMRKLRDFSGMAFSSWSV